MNKLTDKARELSTSNTTSTTSTAASTRLVDTTGAGAVASYGLWLWIYHTTRALEDQPVHMSARASPNLVSKGRNGGQVDHSLTGGEHQHHNEICEINIATPDMRAASAKPYTISNHRKALL